MLMEIASAKFYRIGPIRVLSLELKIQQEVSFIKIENSIRNGLAKCQSSCLKKWFRKKKKPHSMKKGFVRN